MVPSPSLGSGCVFSEVRVERISGETAGTRQDWQDSVQVIGKETASIW